MPRKYLIREDRLPYHVTARNNNQELFPIPLSRVWKLAGHECWKLNVIYNAEIHAFVLMPNHFHMLVTTPEHDLGVVMNYFVSSFTRSVNRSSGRNGHLFGAPYHWSLIDNARYFGHALKYVYRNPVRAKICDRVEKYEFSTLTGLIGNEYLPFPIHYTRSSLELGLPSIDPPEQLRWLNTPFPSEAEKLIGKGLKQKRFSAIMDTKSRSPLEILSQLL